jgi:hypothetical protein
MKLKKSKELSYGEIQRINVKPIWLDGKPLPSQNVVVGWALESFNA